MKRTLKLKLIFFVIFIVLLAAISYAAYRYTNNPTPNKEIKAAIETISQARKSEANKYAKKKLEASDNALKLAMKEWKLQNNKMIVSRDYTQVRILANKATELGKQAKQEATFEKDSISGKIKKQLERIQHQLNEFEKNYKNLPLPISIFEKISRAHIKYKEASSDFKKTEYIDANAAAQEAEKILTPTLKAAKDKLEVYFKSYPTWKKNAQLARQQSANGQIVVLISKFESTCSVLKSGKIIAEYNAEFGSNWMSHKTMMGDNATPEGVYKITLKKNGKKTKYYKALLLDYPNDDDKEKFKLSKKNGAISKKTKIGDLIQIHGQGGKGVNWTEGCIALEDKDMDKLCNLVNENTQVIIIGTEKPLNEYLKK